ncbi:uncharacterized protein TNCV_888991 [Trichonephila clavipes]|nr:uncharacterized protein TNCV_888991 [Trichonephila clavipes]
MFGFDGYFIVRLSRLSLSTVKANCPLQFARSLVFCPPSMCSWYILDTVDLENPNWLRYSEIEWPMRRAPTIYPRSKASKSDSLPKLETPTTNSEQTQYVLNMQLPQHPHLRINNAQRYTVCIALAIPNSVALQCLLKLLFLSMYLKLESY